MMPQVSPDMLWTMILMSCISNLTRVVDGGVVWLFGFISSFMQSRTINRGSTISITAEESDNGRISYNTSAITAIGKYMSRNCVKSRRCIAMCSKSKTVAILPLQAKIVFDGEQISINTDKTKEGPKQTITMNIHAASSTIAANFISHCVREGERMDKMTNKLQGQYMIKQQNDKYYKYPFSSLTTFDTLYLEQKQLIIDNIDKYMRGDLPKLTMLLHGVPGCGKTSLIKAIANYTGYHIIEIKLSEYKDSMRLFDLFRNRYIDVNSMIAGSRYDAQSSFIDGVGVMEIPTRQRIYVLEDVDAEGGNAITRDASNTHVISSKKGTEVQRVSGIYLSDVLNLFDGIIEMDGIILLTTNYIEKIDPALARPGRITLNIPLTYVSSKMYTQMLTDRWPDARIEPMSYKVTPAEITGACDITNNFSDCMAIIDETGKLRTGTPLQQPKSEIASSSQTHYRYDPTYDDYGRHDESDFIDVVWDPHFDSTTNSSSVDSVSDEDYDEYAYDGIMLD